MGDGDAGWQRMERIDRMDISVEEVINAMNDPDYMAKVLEERGWTKKDLLQRAETVANELSAAVAQSNVV